MPTVLGHFGTLTLPEINCFETKIYDVSGYEERKGEINVENQPYFSFNAYLKKIPNNESFKLEADVPLIFNTEGWHMKLWETSSLKQRKWVREAFRTIFPSKNSIHYRQRMYNKLPPLPPTETRWECNPFFSGVDFCGSNGDCLETGESTNSDKFSKDDKGENVSLIENIEQVTITTTSLKTLRKRRASKNARNGEELTEFFKCNCYNGWTGRFCEQDLNECYLASQGSINFCRNGATCINVKPPIKYVCLCEPYTFGKNCEKAYPQYKEGFKCGSTANSSLIDWVPEENFEVLDYFPESTLRNLKTMHLLNSLNWDKVRGEIPSYIYGNEKNSEKKADQNAFIEIGLKLPIKTDGRNSRRKSVVLTETYGKLINLYATHRDNKEERNKDLLRPATWIKYSNPWGFNFKNTVTWSGTPIEYQHVIEIRFPVPILIEGFVVRGGLEWWTPMHDKCQICKRLVIEYRITYKTGSNEWYNIIDDNEKEIIFKTVDQFESYFELEDIGSLDINKARTNWMEKPFSAEAIRLHIIDWWPKNLTFDNNQQIYNHSATIQNIQQNPVMRFDILGCRLEIF